MNKYVLVFVVISGFISACSGNKQREIREQEYAALESQELQKLEQANLERKQKLDVKNLNDVLLGDTARQQKELDDRYQEAAEEALTRQAASRPPVDSPQEPPKRPPAATTADTQSTSTAQNNPTLLTTPQQWRLETVPHPLTGKSECSIISNLHTEKKDDQDITFQVIATKKAIFLQANRLFDDEQFESGFRIDAGFMIPFDDYVQRIAVMDRNYETLISELLTGGFISATVTVFSENNVPLPIIFEFDLESFKAAYEALHQC